MMKFVAAIFAFCLLAFAPAYGNDFDFGPSRVPNGAPYNGGIRPVNATVNVNITFVAPGAGAVQAFTAVGLYSNDPANSRFAFDLGAALGKQITLANGTYEIVFNPQTYSFNCFYYAAYTYAYEAIAKSTAVKTSTVVQNNRVVDFYHGLAHDAGAGTSWISFTASQDPIFHVPVHVEFSQGVPRPFNFTSNSCPPSPVIETGILDFNIPPRCLVNDCVADPSFFSLPPICWDAYTRPWEQIFCFDP